MQNFQTSFHVFLNSSSTLLRKLFKQFNTNISLLLIKIFHSNFHYIFYYSEKINLFLIKKFVLLKKDFNSRIFWNFRFIIRLGTTQLRYTHARFLSNFTKNHVWIMLDIVMQKTECCISRIKVKSFIYWNTQMYHCFILS